MGKLIVSRKVLLFAAISLFMVSCSLDTCWSKWIYLNNYDSFMKKVEKKVDEFSEKEWEEMDKKYETFATTCKDKYWTDLTREEKDKVIEHNMRYLMLRVRSKFSGSFFKDLESGISSLVNKMTDSEIEKNADELKRSWDNLKKDNARDLEKAFTKMGKALEEAGKEIGESANKK